jgi:hypothetical protein
VAGAKAEPKTSDTGFQLDVAFSLLTGALSQHGRDYQCAALELCLRELAQHAPLWVFLAMAETIGQLFGDHPQPPDVLAERLHKLNSVKFARQSPASPATAVEMHEHYYDALHAAARRALSSLHKARRAAKQRAKREGRVLEDMAIEDAVADQTVDILIREVSNFERRDRAAVTAPVVFFLALSSGEAIRQVGPPGDEENPPTSPALFLKPAALKAAGDPRRLLARKALFIDPARPTWGGVRVGADVAAMLLALQCGKGEITTEESWRGKVKQGRKMEKLTARKPGV